MILDERKIKIAFWVFILVAFLLLVWGCAFQKQDRIGTSDTTNKTGITVTGSGNKVTVKNPTSQGFSYWWLTACLIPVGLWSAHVQKKRKGKQNAQSVRRWSLQGQDGSGSKTEHPKC